MFEHTVSTIVPILTNFSKPAVISRHFQKKNSVMNSVRVLERLLRWERLLLMAAPNRKASLKYIFTWFSQEENQSCLLSLYVCQIVFGPLFFFFSCHVSLKDLMAAWHSGSHCRENHSGLSASWSRMCHESRRASFPCVLCGAKEDDKVCEASESYISCHGACKPAYTLGSSTLKMTDRSAWLRGRPSGRVGGAVNGTCGQFSRWYRWLIYIDSQSPKIKQPCGP